MAEGRPFSFGASMEYRAYLEGPRGVAPFFSGGDAALAPMASLSVGPLEARCEMLSSLASGNGAPSFELGETWLKLFLFDCVSVRAGRYEIHPGSALLLTNLSFFAPLNPLGILADDGSSLSNQLELTFLSGDVWGKVAWSPPFLDVPLSRADIAGPYFPLRSFPDEISFESISARRRAIVYASLADVDDRGAGDFLAQIGCDYGIIDATVLAFDGLCRDAAYIPTLVFGEDLFGGNFDVSLKPVRACVTAIGGSFSLAPEAWRSGALELHGEGSYTWGKPAVSTIEPCLTMHDSIWSVEVAAGTRADEAAATIGASWTFSAFSLTLFAEGRLVWRPAAGEEVERPMLPRLLLFGARGKVFSDRLEWTLAAADEMEGPSWILGAGLVMQLAGESSLQIQSPICLGPPESAFGQYAGKERIVIAVKEQL